MTQKPSRTRYGYDRLQRRTTVAQGYRAFPIAFVSERDVAQGDIYVLNPLDGETQRITNTGQITWGPDWSPDGRKIAFYDQRSNPNSNQIYVMDADGSNLQAITPYPATNTDPAWSPDGSQFAFVSDNPPALYRMDADGSNSQLLYQDTVNLYQVRSLRWSPDGQKIAFHLQNSADTMADIYVINANGTGLTNLTQSFSDRNRRPYWSPDGQRIVFESKRDGNQEIYVMNADGSNPVNLTQNSSDDFRPVWSPDGTQIAFHSLRDGNREIYVMNADASEQTRITQNTSTDWELAWSPWDSDPARWVWSTDYWEDANGAPIEHGANNDRNIVARVVYDKAGRMTSLRDPRGNLTEYEYDLLDRRTKLTNPLSQEWTTAYEDVFDSGSPTGETQVTMTYPGLAAGGSYDVTRQFDRLGRLANIDYGAPTTTPNVAFTYNAAGNRTQMTETGSSSTIREMNYAYDDVHRLTSVGFDNDGSGSIDQTVGYEYDAGGLRTRLTLPGSLNVVYTYDQRGQLVSLTDWDSQATQFAYDNVGRHIATVRANGLRSRYEYDAASRLRALRHTSASKTLAQFIYTVDKRGNRIEAQETLAHPATTNDVTIAYNDKSIVTLGTWTNVSSYKESTALRASLLVSFFGDAAALTMGTGSDHSLYDIYIDGSLWQSFDGFGAGTDRVIQVTTETGSGLTHEGLHILEIRNRIENPSRNKVRFKQLVIADQEYDLQTITYGYDALSRLTEARYAPSVNANAVDADLLRRYLYTYDLSGNRLSESLALNGGSPTVTSYTYNAANQITNSGFTYDANGNLLFDNILEYTWDRANRLLVGDQFAYTYDGMGNRRSQTYVGPVLFGTIWETNPTIDYLLDLQPGLATVLMETQGPYTTRYVHGPRGIHAQQNTSGAWTSMMQDGLGSVRGVVDNSLTPLESRLYDPYGTPYGTSGGSQTPYGFTGEPTDSSGLLYLRARYYASGLGVFTALDPWEGMAQHPMSLNGYSWVEGNVINSIDHTGMIMENPSMWDKCSRSFGNSLQDLTTIPCALFDRGGSYVTISTTAAQVTRGETALFQTFITVNELADIITGVGGIVGATCQIGRGDAGRALFTATLALISIAGGLPGAVVAAFITSIDLVATMFGFDLYDLLPGVNSSIPNSSGMCLNPSPGAIWTEGDAVAREFVPLLALMGRVSTVFKYQDNTINPIDELFSNSAFTDAAGVLARSADPQSANGQLDTMLNSLTSYAASSSNPYFVRELTQYPQFFLALTMHYLQNDIPNQGRVYYAEGEIIQRLEQLGVSPNTAGAVFEEAHNGVYLYTLPPC